LQVEQEEYDEQGAIAQLISIRRRMLWRAAEKKARANGKFPKRNVQLRNLFSTELIPTPDVFFYETLIQNHKTQCALLEIWDVQNVYDGGGGADMDGGSVDDESVPALPLKLPLRLPPAGDELKSYVGGAIGAQVGGELNASALLIRVVVSVGAWYK
jgi:hypothetical protein